MYSGKKEITEQVSRFWNILLGFYSYADRLFSLNSEFFYGLVESVEFSSVLLTDWEIFFNSSAEDNFDYNKCCIFCAKKCLVEPDEKHPDRFEKNPGYLCRTANRGQAATFKEALEKVAFLHQGNYHSIQTSWNELKQKRKATKNSNTFW